MTSSRLGYLAVKKETTVAKAVKPTNFIGFKDWNVNFVQEVMANNPIHNNRWNPIQSKVTKVNVEWTYNMDLDVNEAGYFFLAGIGTYWVSVPEAGAFRHTFNVANTLPALSIEQGRWNISWADYEVDRAVWVLIDSLEITASDGIANLAVGLMAHGLFQKTNLIADATAGVGATLSTETTYWLVNADTIKVTDSSNTEDTSVVSVVDDQDFTADLANSYTVANNAKVELTPQTPSFNDPKIFTFHNAKFQFGTDLTNAASANEDCIEDWTFSYQNQLEERFASKRKSPSVIAPKWASATLSFTKYFENSEDRDAYLDQDRKACIVTMDLGEKIGATSLNYTMQLRMNDLRYTTFSMNTGTDELYALEVEATVFYNSTDGKAFEIIIDNDVADYTA